jgi:NADH-quinone oxidoreductase subunit A
VYPQRVSTNTTLPPAVLRDTCNALGSTGFGWVRVRQGVPGRFHAPTREEHLFDDWLPFAIYALFAAAIPVSMVFFSFTLATRPSRRTRARTLPFESGVSTGSPSKQRFTVSFYLTAMLFILFDIEIVFLYPLAVILNELQWFGFAEFVVFLAILLVAYVYIWRKGALDWR